jgi:hypothetical protein
MKIEGREVIGKQTEVSARTLLSVSAIVIVIQVYKISGNDWDFLGQKFPAEVVDHLLPILLFFFLIGHILHWYADHVAFRNWFKISEVFIGTIGSASAINNTEWIGDGLIRRMRKLVEEIEQTQTNIKDGSTDTDLNHTKVLQRTATLASDMTDINATLKGMSSKHQRVTGMAFLLVYIWYLAVPVLAFVVALSFVCT